MSGYQADIAVRYDGSLYDESRRKRMLAVPKPEVLARAQKPLGEWNVQRIRAEGPRIHVGLHYRQRRTMTMGRPTLPRRLPPRPTP